MGIQDLIQWALSHGATLHENVEVQEDDTGFSLRTHAEGDGIRITAGPKKPIVSCPLHLSLSAFNAFWECSLSRLTGRDDPTGFPQVFLDRTPFHIIGKFFLCQQYLMSRDSFWFPYISSLPQSGGDECTDGSFTSNDAERLGTPLFWTEDDLNWIRGTNMDAARLERLELWRKEWRDGCDILRDQGFSNWESYTYNIFGWASTIFSSRCFVSSLLPGHALENELSSLEWIERVGKEHNTSQILFPLVDLANHDPAAKLTWTVDKSHGTLDLTVDAFQIISETDLLPGQEVFNNYGSTKYNSELLLGYGFCLPDIKNDYIAIEFTRGAWLESAHKLWETRTCYCSTTGPGQLDCNPQGGKIKRRFILGWQNRRLEERTGIAAEFQVFDHGLFDLLAIELANVSETAYIVEHPTLCIETASPKGPLARLLIATTSAIVEKLGHDLAKIQECGNLKEPMTTAQHHGKIYREGQLLLLTQKIASLEQHLKSAYITRIIEGKRDIIPPVIILTLKYAYESLKEFHHTNHYKWVEEVYENSRRILELEPAELLYSPEVIGAGWESTLWILWLCIPANLGSLSSQPNQAAHVSQWIKKMETKYPVRTDALDRQFSGDNQEKQTLLDILEGTAVAKHDQFELSERITWASYVVREETIKNLRVWRGGGGSEGEMGKVVEERGLVVF